MTYYNLGAINQWRNVDYVTRDNQGGITCKLCNAGPMHKNNANSHFNGSVHAMNFNSVKNKQEKEQGQRERIEKAEVLQPRIDQLGLSRWKHHLQSLIYLYISPNTTDIRFVEAYLTKYERMEITSLLELAVLKYAVCADAAFSSMQEVYDYKALEDGFDPQAFLRSQRMTCGSNVIIPLVMGYLWK